MDSGKHFAVNCLAKGKMYTLVEFHEWSVSCSVVKQNVLNYQSNFLKFKAYSWRLGDSSCGDKVNHVRRKYEKYVSKRIITKSKEGRKRWMECVEENIVCQTIYNIFYVTFLHSRGMLKSFYDFGTCCVVLTSVIPRSHREPAPNG